MMESLLDNGLDVSIDDGHDPIVRGARIAGPNAGAKVLGICVPKGGTGKSTVTAGVAVAAHEDGWKCTILDIDPQGTLREWAQARQGIAPRVIAVDTGTINSVVGALRSSGDCDLILIDTPGGEGLRAELAMRVSDFCLIPSRPTMLDIPCAIKAVRLLRLQNRRHAVVLTQCFAHMARVDDARALFQSRGILTAPSIGCRVDHQDAIGLGRGVTEARPSGAAAREIRALWQWIRAQLDETEN